MSSSSRVLVTGGAGYIGSMLVPELLCGGHSVTVLDTFMYGQDGLAAVCGEPGFELVRGDARAADVLKPLLAKADVLIPLAGHVGAPLAARDPAAATSVNLDAIRTLVGLASPAQRILFPTTNSGYGASTGVCTEETPLRPLSGYARDKIEAEKIVLGRDNGLSFRLATAFGMSPRMRLDLLVNDFTYRAFHDRYVVLFQAHFKRNFIHVRDVVRAFQHAMERFDAMKGRAYNLGLSDANLSKLELCERIRRQLPGFVFPEAPVGADPDQRDHIVSNERLEKTGFKPSRSLDDGIAELIRGCAMLRNSRYGNI